MDYGRESGNVVQIITGREYWGDQQQQQQPVWATEDEYGVWDREASADRQRSGSEPPNKKSGSKAIGKMFFKTKLCCKFRAGTCPYVTNCNFAHSIEELRRPPPNWQEIVAAAHANEEEDSPREEFQIPSLGSSSFAVDSQRSYKGRHCKKFYTEEGCPYGDNCTFLHDEQSKARESVVISLGPGSGGYSSAGGGGNGGGGGGGASAAAAEAAAAAAASAANPMLKPSNWKTRICNKWEQTGYCPFGSKCHFAHGAAELHRYGGGLVDIESPIDPTKQGLVVTMPSSSSKPPIESSVDGYHHHHVGAPSRLPGVIPRTGQRPFQKWKGPDKISRIYGDWIDDIE